MNLSHVLYGPKVIFTKSHECSSVSAGGRGFVQSLVGGVHTVVSPQSQSACSPQLEEEEDHGKNGTNSSTQ